MFPTVWQQLPLCWCGPIWSALVSFFQLMSFSTMVLFFVSTQGLGGCFLSSMWRMVWSGGELLFVEAVFFYLTVSGVGRMARGGFGGNARVWRIPDFLPGLL